MTLKKIALFDLDHTLIPLDSDFAWGEFTTALGWTDAASFQAQNHAFYEHYKAGTLDIHAYVRFSTEAIRRWITMPLRWDRAKRRAEAICSAGTPRSAKVSISSVVV